ncbi:MAG: hypothetical protein ACC700_16745 [Anaerolineales bacterium]
MRQRIWDSIRQNPGRVALALAVLLGLVNTLLIATAFRNRSAAGELVVQVIDLTESLAQLRQVEQEGLRGLEEGAISAEAELAALEQSFPQHGEPFDIYRQGFALAQANQVEIRAMETGPSSFKETPVGLLEVTTYRIDGAGQHLSCIGLLAALEQTGLETLALDEITLGLEDQTCDFEVVLASAAELGEIDVDG